MRIKLLYTAMLFILPMVVCSQFDTGYENLPDIKFVGADSLWHEKLEKIDVYPRSRRKSKRYKRKQSRLAAKVKKVYPYAKLASKKLEEYNSIYVSFETDRERKKYIKKVEKDIFREFGDKVKRLKISEGRILIKLIDREIGTSSFEIIKEFKGGFSAFFWQTVAKLFGNDLKAKYDPYGKDWMIEYIVLQIESGRF
jgi:hypothetical protein